MVDYTLQEGPGVVGVLLECPRRSQRMRSLSTNLGLLVRSGLTSQMMTQSWEGLLNCMGLMGNILYV